MKTLYIDCFAGASGNMFLGGLISLGLKPEKLNRELKKLQISKFEIEFSNVNRAGINSIHATTIYSEDKHHRHFSDIEKIIKESNLSKFVKQNSINIFENLARAEAKVHGIDFEKVHFHEVGAMDAIIDVVGTCIGVEFLEIEDFLCSNIHVGSGFIQMAHGKYPVPPPAVAELLKEIPIYSTEIEGELITPTGAAIISTLCQKFGIFSDFQIEKIGHGAGSRNYEKFPNVLRLMLGEMSSGFGVRDSGFINEKENKTDHRPPTTDRLIQIKTNLDDVSPEILGFVLEKALEMGALDCWFTPIQMKKNRPATLLTILSRVGDRDKFTELLYTETSTLGIRISFVERECLERKFETVETDFGKVQIKVARLGKRIVNIKPEFEQIKKIALKTNKTLKEVENLVLVKYQKQIEE